MTTTINASATNGLQQTADGSGILKVQSNGVTTNALAWGKYNYVASGSVPTLGAAYNISSITRTAAGTYSFAFTNAQADANYAVVGLPTWTSSQSLILNVFGKTTSGFSVYLGYVNSTTGTILLFDYGIDFAVFGN